MGKEIRLFLCLRSLVSGERVSVHRTLEDVKTEWLEARANCPEVSGLFHAGTDRPSFDTFRVFLEAHKGFLFISEAARWLLGDSDVERRVAALSLNAIPQQRSQPVYLAVAGWGYDISLRRESVEFAEIEPNHVSREVFARHMSTINSSDPFDVARIFPRSLIQLALSEIPMPIRCQNVLAKQEISSVGQLQGLHLRDALRWTNFGKKSATDLAEALFRYIDSRLGAGDILVGAPVEENAGEMETASASMFSTARATTLQEELEGFVSILKPSQQTVLRERLLNQKRLEKVGEIMGVTRERVRQIEGRLLDALTRVPWIESLRKRLFDLLGDRSDPLFLDLIEVEDPWFSGWSFRSRELAALISAIPSDLKIMLSQDRIIVSRISQDHFDGVLKNALGFLNQQINEEWSPDDVELFVEGALRTERAAELAGLAMDLLRPELHFSSARAGEKAVLRSVGSRLNEVIMAILGAADGPLHYSEIAGALSIRMGKDLTVHNVHARLPRTSALFFGRGRYGIEAHYPVALDSEIEVAAIVEDIMMADPDRQWHTSELMEFLEVRGEDLPDSLDKYILNILLSRCKDFQGMGRMVWSLKAGHRADRRGRIDLMDACVQVLIEAGHALHQVEIKERIGRLRGTSEFFFIQPTERMARVAPNKWGLIDRDFRLTPNERASFLNDLEAALECKAVSFHVSELPKLLEKVVEARNNPTEYMLMGLVQTDHRFRVHRGRLIAIATWSDARRHNVRSAVGKCVGDGRKDVSVTGLITEVTDLLGREVHRGEVTNTLLQLGWRREGLTDTYVMCFEEDEELADESPNDMADEIDHSAGSALMETRPAAVTSQNDLR